MAGPGERMTLEQFYADDRRRRSPEVTFGLDWTSASDPYAAYGLHWISATKEIYVLRAPRVPINSVPPYFGDTAPPIFVSPDSYEVMVLGTAEAEDALAAAIAGWEPEMAKPDSLRWVRERLCEAAGRAIAD